MLSLLTYFESQLGWIYALAAGVLHAAGPSLHCFRADIVPWFIQWFVVGLNGLMIMILIFILRFVSPSNVSKVCLDSRLVHHENQSMDWKFSFYVLLAAGRSNIKCFMTERSIMVGNNYIYFLEMCEAYPVHTMQSVYGFLSKKKKRKMKLWSFCLPSLRPQYHPRMCLFVHLLLWGDLTVR